MIKYKANGKIPKLKFNQLVSVIIVGIDIFLVLGFIFPDFYIKIFPSPPGDRFGINWQTFFVVFLSPFGSLILLSFLFSPIVPISVIFYLIGINMFYIISPLAFLYFVLVFAVILDYKNPENLSVRLAYIHLFLSPITFILSLFILKNS